MALATAVTNGTPTQAIVSQTADGIILMPAEISAMMTGANTAVNLPLAGALSAAKDKNGRPKLQRAWYCWKANKAKLTDGHAIGFSLVDDNGVVNATEVIDAVTGEALNPSKPKPKRAKGGKIVTHADGSPVLEGGGNPTKRWTARLVLNGQPYQFKAVVTDVLKNADEDGTSRYFMEVSVFPVRVSQGIVIPDFEGEGLSF